MGDAGYIVGRWHDDPFDSKCWTMCGPFHQAICLADLVPIRILVSLDGQTIGQMQVPTSAKQVFRRRPPDTQAPG